MPASGTRKCETNLQWPIEETCAVDVPDSPAQWTIELTAIDVDPLGGNAASDVSPAAGRTTLGITYDIQTMAIPRGVASGTADGSDGGSSRSGEEDGRLSITPSTVS